MVEMGHPTVLELHVAGVPAEGEELEVQYMYQGGHEGKSQLQWIRCALASAPCASKHMHLSAR